MLGNAMGPFITGKIFDATGGYELAFSIFIICFAIAIALTLLIRRPKWEETIKDDLREKI